MKVGSLVELVDDNFNKLLNEDITLPIKNKVYTVREFYKAETLGIDYTILLQEITNPKKLYKQGFGEKGFNADRFREPLPPISNIEETINQNTLEYTI